MFEYKDIKINYKEYGKKGEDAIVFLHGWGQNIQMMEPIANPFIKTHHLVIIDLPGFGKSEEPKTVWELDEYVEMIHELLTSLKIKKPNRIGHSFGILFPLSDLSLVRVSTSSVSQSQVQLSCR